MARGAKPATDIRQAEAEIDARLASMTLAQLNLTAAMADQILERHDDEIIDTFLRWSETPEIDALLRLAAALDSEALARLMEVAREIAAEE